MAGFRSLLAFWIGGAAGIEAEPVEEVTTYVRTARPLTSKPKQQFAARTARTMTSKPKDP
jgi:hypothetical protein